MEIEERVSKYLLWSEIAHKQFYNEFWLLILLVTNISYKIKTAYLTKLYYGKGLPRQIFDNAHIPLSTSIYDDY